MIAELQIDILLGIGSLSGSGGEHEGQESWLSFQTALWPLHEEVSQKINLFFYSSLSSFFHH